ncbi:MAG: flagellar motor switch protein FliM [Desulfobacterales bacterium]|nr:flagellar motor switch protein FliM [Desulfobacterales bacterium]
MSDVLDQNEVDALLAAVGDGDNAAADAASGADAGFSTSTGDVASLSEIYPYDFKRPERVSKDQMRALQTLHEGFGRNLGASLSGFLRTIVEVRVARIEQLTYGEFINALPNPTSFNLLGCDPLEGQVCLEISPLIIYPIIDRLMGGSNAELFIPQRPLTVIEQRLVGKITDRAMVALSEAWEGVCPVQFELEQTESNPQFVQIVPPNEVVVVVGFELKMGGRAGTMSLCIPFNVIEPIIENLASQAWQSPQHHKADNTSRMKVTANLDRASINATALLAKTTITVGDLVNMSPGDIVVTEKSASQPVVLCVEGRPKYLAHLGQHKGKRAIQVIRQVEPKDRV